MKGLINPMDKHLLQNFISEIARQCRFCLIAYEDLHLAFQQRDINYINNRVWYSVQSFLTASGNISKLLYGLNNKQYNERTGLRQSLGIDDNSPFKNRDARNYFEHFDERLERWFNSSTRHNFVDSNIGPLNRVGGVDEHDFVRNFDPERMAITFYGDECAMLPIIEAAKQLKERARIEAESNRWYLPF
jgi:hypothetical protein